MFRSHSRLRMQAKTLRTLCASFTEGAARLSRRVAFKGLPPVFLRAPCGSPFSPQIRNAGSESAVDLPLPDALYHKHDGFLTQADDRCL